MIYWFIKTGTSVASNPGTIFLLWDHFENCSNSLLIYRKYIKNWRGRSYCPHFFYEFFIYDIIMGKKFGSITPLTSVVPKNVLPNKNVLYILSTSKTIHLADKIINGPIKMSYPDIFVFGTNCRKIWAHFYFSTRTLATLSWSKPRYNKFFSKL